MVSVLNSRLSGLCSSPGRGRCVVFLGKTQSVNLMLGVTLRSTSIPSRGEEKHD